MIADIQVLSQIAALNEAERVELGLIDTHQIN
jgi:hypothetical protein